MSSQLKLPCPVGVALHTAGKKRDQEYGWYVEQGAFQLFDTMKNIHRALLRDVSGESPKLAVLKKGQYIGFLIGDMISPRREYYANRILYNTLYLEFEYKPDILNYFANLLRCTPETYEEMSKTFNDFSERCYQQEEYQFSNLPVLTEITVQDYMKIATGKKSALYNNMINRQRCAAFLLEKVMANDTVCCVTTGRISIERCKQAVTENSFISIFLILTLASEMENIGETALELKTERNMVNKVWQFLRKSYL